MVDEYSHSGRKRKEITRKAPGPDVNGWSHELSFPEQTIILAKVQCDGISTAEGTLMYQSRILIVHGSEQNSTLISRILASQTS